jgi:integrase
MLLERRQTAHKAIKKAGEIAPWVFFRMRADERGGTKHPRKITTFKVEWQRACRAAGCPGRIPHDLRRTAVRNLVRRGISEHTAMKLTGHETRSVFDRYDIVSGDDLKEAARKMDAIVG